MMINKNLMMIGLPGAGKTTFLAALWHTVEAEEIACEYKCNKVSGDRAYLEKLRNQWLSCEEFQRTKLSEGIINTHIELINNDQTKIINLKIPDLAGENFENHFEDRLCSEKFKKSLNDCDSILLFVNPIETNDAHLISEIPIEEDGTDQTNEDAPSFNVEKFDAKNLPCQIKLVENLQLIDAIATTKIAKIAVIVSAWDTLPNHDPDKWVKAEMPLLHQYLNNLTGVNLEFFGVSAQGGSNPEELKNIVVPSQKIIVRIARKEYNDITKILDWFFK